MNLRQSYFTELTCFKAVFYLVALAYVFFVCIVLVLEPLLTLPCQPPSDLDTPEFENVLFKYNPCRYIRTIYLLGLTPEECMFGRRIVFSVILGGLIGWERRQADRPAGIRTMSLVSLGSCLFTICSAFAFLSGPMSWDASRISAAIPSGVGFLGAGLIYKHAVTSDLGEGTHVVHGLTTATSLWLSAAVGIACGGGLYFAASFTVAVMLVLLRFAPRTNFGDKDEEEDEDEEEKNDTVMMMDRRPSYSSIPVLDASIPVLDDDAVKNATDTEKQVFIKRKDSLKRRDSHSNLTARKRRPELV